MLHTEQINGCPVTEEVLDPVTFESKGFRGSCRKTGLEKTAGQVVCPLAARKKCVFALINPQPGETNRKIRVEGDFNRGHSIHGRRVA